jgi:phosphoribosylglycinamide formyltransferase-1
MKAATVEKLRERLIQLCEALPEVETSGDQHLAFRVRKKTFAWFLNDHHGDGRIALCCKAHPGDQDFLVRWDPVRFYVPSYVGPKGWVAFRLDLAAVDWDLVHKLVFDSYRLIAPKKLAALAKQTSQPGANNPSTRKNETTQPRNTSATKKRRKRPSQR